MLIYKPKSKPIKKVWRNAVAYVVLTETNVLQFVVVVWKQRTNYKTICLFPYSHGAAIF